MFEHIISTPALVMLNPNDHVGTYLNGVWSAYDFQRSAYGTECSSGFDLSIEEHPEKEEVIIRFYTAWTPADPVVAKLAMQFPDVDINYLFWGEGCGFAGFREYTSGEISDCDDGDIEVTENSDGVFFHYPQFMLDILGES